MLEVARREAEAERRRQRREPGSVAIQQVAEDDLTNRVEDRDCGITAGAGAPGVAAAVFVPGADGRVTCTRIVSRRGGVRTFDCAASGEPTSAANTAMAVVWRCLVAVRRWCIRTAFEKGARSSAPGYERYGGGEFSAPAALRRMTRVPPAFKGPDHIGLRNHRPRGDRGDVAAPAVPSPYLAVCPMTARHARRPWPRARTLPGLPRTVMTDARSADPTDSPGGTASWFARTVGRS